MSLKLCLAAAVCAAGLANAQAAFQYATTADWGQGFTGQITIGNPGSQPLSQWVLSFDFPPSINVIWNATIVSQTGAHYVVQSAGWNDTIAPNGSVSFGFTGSPGNVQQGPANFQLTSAAASVAPSGGGSGPSSAPSGSLSVTITPTAVWSGGFTANLAVNNAGAQAVANWSLGLTFVPTIQSMWNGIFTVQGQQYQISGAGGTASIPAGGSVTVGFTAAGSLNASSASACVINGAVCAITIGQAPPPAPPVTPVITIPSLDGQTPATQFTIAQTASGQTPAAYPLSVSGISDPQFIVATNNPSVATASISGTTLQVTGLAAGRAGLQIQETSSGAVRYIGVRVENQDGSLPGLPNYVSLGSVSDDGAADLSFWQTFAAGNLSHRVDSRYIYLNGGPLNGWTTWTADPGGRASSYIQNSRMFGMIPFFVYYNIPDSSEGYQLDVSHAQDPNYMAAYFQNLQLTLNLIQANSPDDPVGMILEPDFLGYLAQNANAPAAAIPAATSAVYTSGVLNASSDPAFPNTVAGLVQAINYTISKYAPQVVFGWELNLWASPAGGWTTPVPVTGLMHKTDTGDFQTGRQEIATEAAAIASYYVAAGVTSYGAGFITMDKYGLDAAGVEASAATDPAHSTWFWNNDLWGNYLTFAGAVNQTTHLPVVLWQLPAGHINSTAEADPYSSSGTFPDLADTYQSYEDSAPTFFFGDAFATSGARLAYFSTNNGGDSSLSASGQSITWGSHMAAAAQAGVMAVMFGAGVGNSTTNVGNPPTDSFWWITKAQDYLASPAPPAQK